MKTNRAKSLAEKDVLVSLWFFTAVTMKFHSSISTVITPVWAANNSRQLDIDQNPIFHCARTWSLSTKVISFLSHIGFQKHKNKNFYVYRLFCCNRLS